MKRIVLSVLMGGILAFFVVAHPASGQGGPPPPPPPGGGGPPGGQIPPPCPPSGCPTNTPTATPIPTATPTATPTNTPIPCFATLSLSKKTVKVGKKQKVTVSTVAGASVAVTVKYPNKSKKTKRGTADSGAFTWSYKQPANKTTAKSRKVSVSATATCSGQPPVSAKKSYKIG